MSETFNLINQLSDERLNLYRLAGKQHLTVAQHERLTEITNQLPALWDQYRRESMVDQRVTSLNDQRPAA